MIPQEQLSQIPTDYQEFYTNAIGLSGRIATVEYLKECSPKKTAVKKGFEGKIEKRSVFQVRPGVDYENIAVVKEKHETGEMERKGLPSSMEKIYKGVYHHLHKDTWYLGVAPLQSDNSIRITEWFLDGEKVELDDIKEYLYSSDFNNKDAERLWMTLPIENIQSIKCNTNGKDS